MADWRQLGEAAKNSPEATYLHHLRTALGCGDLLG